MLLTIIAGACALFGQACADDPSLRTSSPNPAREVASDDGMATLTIPAGALPEGVTIEDIRVERVEALLTASEGEADLLAVYRLSPDGTTFLKPLTLEVAIDLPRGHSVMPVVISGGKVEGPDPSTIALNRHTEGNSAHLSLGLNHFSDVALVEWAGDVLEIKLNHRQERPPTVGSTVNVWPTVTKQDYHWGGNAALSVGGAKPYEVVFSRGRALEEPYYLRGDWGATGSLKVDGRIQNPPANAMFDHFDPDIDPELNQPRVLQVFACQREGAFKVDFSANITFMAQIDTYLVVDGKRVFQENGYRLAMSQTKRLDPDFESECVMPHIRAVRSESGKTTYTLASPSSLTPGHTPPTGTPVVQLQYFKESNADSMGRLRTPEDIDISEQVQYTWSGVRCGTSDGRDTYEFVWTHDEQNCASSAGETVKVDVLTLKDDEGVERHYPAYQFSPLPYQEGSGHSGHLHCPGWDHWHALDGIGVYPLADGDDDAPMLLEPDPDNCGYGVYRESGQYVDLDYCSTTQPHRKTFTLEQWDHFIEAHPEPMPYRITMNTEQAEFCPEEHPETTISVAVASNPTSFGWPHAMVLGPSYEPANHEGPWDPFLDDLVFYVLPETIREYDPVRFSCSYTGKESGDGPACKVEQ